jgi:signal transduction histidine kinase
MNPGEAVNLTESVNFDLSDSDSVAAKKVETTVHPSHEDLRTIPVFADLSTQELDWLSQHMTLAELQAGETFLRPGEPADRLFAIFEGEVCGEREIDGRTFTGHAGQVTGALPFSRLKSFTVQVHATVLTRAGVLHKEHFMEMLTTIPVLQSRLIGLLADRIRETTMADQQRDKLMALGKLSAGLAHELNNPAAAGRRAADTLRQVMTDLRAANVRIGQHDIGLESRRYLTQLEYEWAEAAPLQTAMDTLERSDREEQLMVWLEQHGVQNAWKLAPGLVDAGITPLMLEAVVERVPREFLTDGLTRLTASVGMTRLLSEIQSTMSRISDLVRAIKEYSYMDQMPVQEVDIHEGIENTLIMLGYRLKSGIEIVREFDRSIPKITARGGELNQVWTNLFSNAIDAMDGKGKLRIHTVLEAERVLIEVIDSGAGIPPEIQGRIFEPFFTTKGFCQGTGLGLDIVHRIVINHGGDIKFDSKPGQTRFCVRLPLRRVSAKHTA